MAEELEDPLPFDEKKQTDGISGNLIYPKTGLFQSIAKSSTFILVIYKKISPYIKGIQEKVLKKLEEGLRQILFHHYLNIPFDQFAKIK